MAEQEIDTDGSTSEETKDVSDDRRFTIEAHDISQVAEAPDVTFGLGPDGAWMDGVDLPDGFGLRVTPEEPDKMERTRSRIVLTRGDEVYADVALTHHLLGDEWDQPALYAGQIACALFWSAWRRLKLDAIAEDERGDNGGDHG